LQIGKMIGILHKRASNARPYIYVYFKIGCEL